MYKILFELIQGEKVEKKLKKFEEKKLEKS